VDYQRLLLDHLDLVDQIVRTIGRRRHLSSTERDDFASFVHLRLVEDDYAILRKFQNRSTLWTYLATVIEHLALDFYAQKWGRWRPSAVANRLGPIAVLLERLVTRDSHTIGEAMEIVRTNHGVASSDAELRTIFDQLPVRVRTTEVGEEAAVAISGGENSESIVEDADRFRGIARLQRALTAAFAQIAVQDRVLIALRFDQNLSVVEIAKLTGSSVPTLHRRLDKSVKQLRLALTNVGFDSQEIANLIGHPSSPSRPCCVPRLRGFWGLSVYPNEMVSPHTYGCPEPEVLAAYVDRGLSLSERARVDAHLASCPQCIALVAGVARTVEALSVLRPNAAVSAEATPLMTRRAFGGALAAAAAVIAVLATPALVRPWLGRDSGLVNLVDIGEQRSVLGRLTGGFPHAPLGAPSAGGQGGRPAEADRVQLTAGRIRESFGDRETPSQMHAVGVSQLLAGRYDDAAQSLLAASREQPANARYLSDVAAVQLERARLGLRPDDLPRALAAADRARRLDPSLKEAWFNRALAASALSLNAEARAAWTEYLKRDSVSPWASEARSRLDELSKTDRAERGRRWRPVCTRPLTRQLATRPCERKRPRHEASSRTSLANWANAVLKRQRSAGELERARASCAGDAARCRRCVIRDAVSAIDRARRLAAHSFELAKVIAITPRRLRFSDDRFVRGAGFSSGARALATVRLRSWQRIHQGRDRVRERRHRKRQRC
jgi:RNA polymerase sigma factor for flagellar operon FliA